MSRVKQKPRHRLLVRVISGLILVVSCSSALPADDEPRLFPSGWNFTAEATLQYLQWPVVSKDLKLTDVQREQIHALFGPRANAMSKHDIGR